MTKPTRETVLALDVAEKTGFFSAHGSGTWNFHESWERNHNMQHKAFRDTLIQFITQHGIVKIVAEDVNVSTNFTALRKLSELRGILLEVCDELGLPEPTFVNVSKLKKWATGNGNATKADMIQACINRWRVTPCDDNEADAAHLYYYYIKTFNL